jgi:hypothetical protein
MGKMKNVFIYKEIKETDDIAFMKFCQLENEREHEKQMLALFDKMEGEKQNEKNLLS